MHGISCFDQEFWPSRENAKSDTHSQLELIEEPGVHFKPVNLSLNPSGRWSRTFNKKHKKLVDRDDVLPTKTVNNRGTRESWERTDNIEEPRTSELPMSATQKRKKGLDISWGEETIHMVAPHQDADRADQFGTQKISKADLSTFTDLHKDSQNQR